MPIHRILILRHAHAAHPAGIDDRFRPLDEKGGEQARLVARRMREKGLHPGRVLCSAAQRTRETLAPVLSVWPDLDISYEDGLYTASPGDWFARLQDLGEDCGSVLLVGHNPAMHGLAFMLAGGGDPALLARIRGGYAPAWLSILDCGELSWADLRPGAGLLNDLITGDPES